MVIPELCIQFKTFTALNFYSLHVVPNIGDIESVMFFGSEKVLFFWHQLLHSLANVLSETSITQFGHVANVFFFSSSDNELICVVL